MASGTGSCNSSIRRQEVARPVKELLLDLAKAAQRAVDMLEGDPGEVVGRGADGAPSTRLDRAAESAVLRRLEEKGASLDVLSEEAGFVDRHGDGLLVLDPVDGTHNALRGVPAFSVSLAMGHTRLGDIEAGMVRDLVSGATYYAAKGRGADLDGRPIHARPYDPEDVLFSVYLGSNADLDAARVAAKARRVRHLGAASLDLCLVARGAADAYYMHSREERLKLRACDIAAGTLIVREAGGQVLDLRGHDLDMPLTVDAHTDLVAVGDRKVWEAIQ
jgi:fructose-1,6-bisphosphatase/inositol monophosphatase family enzyme